MVGSHGHENRQVKTEAKRKTAMVQNHQTRIKSQTSGKVCSGGSHWGNTGEKVHSNKAQLTNWQYKKKK